MKRLLALIIALLASLSVAFAAVNVNTATQAELESLNGIGPAKAKAIIDYRAKNGPFKSVEELDKVPGIGQGTLAKIRNDVTLSGKTAVPAEVKSAEKKSAERKIAAPANARESAEDTSRSKAAKSTTGGIAKDSGEQKVVKKSATAGVDPSSAPGSTKEPDKKTAQANEKKSKPLKKDEAKSETAK